MKMMVKNTFSGITMTCLEKDTLNAENVAVINFNYFFFI